MLQDKLQLSKMKILIINPNSTQAMTSSLQKGIELLCLPNSIFVEYYTASKLSNPPAPESINNQVEAAISTEAVINDMQASKQHYFTEFDGYLIACYSDHPLVQELQKYTKPGAVVMGIFQASMLYALQFATETNKAAILTSGADWETILDEAVGKFCGCESDSFPHNKFENTIAAGVPVLKLHTAEAYPIIQKKIQSLIKANVGTILLGCAGLSCLTKQMKQDFPGVDFVDSVITGLKLIMAYIEMENM